MKEFLKLLSESNILQIFGGITIIISASFGFLGSILKEIVFSKIDKSKQKEIEILKGQLSKNENVLLSIVNAMSNSYVSSNSMILEHYQKVWNAMLGIKKNISPFVYIVYTVFTKEEFYNIKTQPKIYDGILECDMISEQRKLNSIDEKIEESRIFISPKAWIIFFVFRALYSRITYLAYENAKNDKRLYWLDDQVFISQIINSVISNDEFSKLIENPLLALPNVSNYLEFQFQKEVQKQVYGKALKDETIALAIDMSKIEVGNRKK
jgi:hypothetical protein